MIKYYTKKDGRLKTIEELEPSCWVNISPPFDQEELERIAQLFEIPLDFLTDSLDVDERSRYEKEDDVRLIVVNTPMLNEINSDNLKRNLIEKELYDSSRNKQLRQLLSIEKSLVYFVNSLSANELLKMKMKRSDFLGIRADEEKTDLFEDIIIDNSQALEMSNVYTNILNGTMEAYASIISNNLNEVIQRLTLVTIILMVPTLVASLYGMNFKYLPFANHPYGFYLIIFISIIISMLLGWWFRRKRLF